MTGRRWHSRRLGPLALPQGALARPALLEAGALSALELLGSLLSHAERLPEGFAAALPPEDADLSEAALADLHEHHLRLASGLAELYSEPDQGQPGGLRKRAWRRVRVRLLPGRERARHRLNDALPRIPATLLSLPGQLLLGTLGLDDRSPWGLPGVALAPPLPLDDAQLWRFRLTGPSPLSLHRDDRAHWNWSARDLRARFTLDGQPIALQAPDRRIVPGMPEWPAARQAIQAADARAGLLRWSARGVLWPGVLMHALDGHLPAEHPLRPLLRPAQDLPALAGVIGASLEPTGALPRICGGDPRVEVQALVEAPRVPLARTFSAFGLNDPSHPLAATVLPQLQLLEQAAEELVASRWLSSPAEDAPLQAGLEAARVAGLAVAVRSHRHLSALLTELWAAGLEQAMALAPLGTWLGRMEVLPLTAPALVALSTPPRRSQRLVEHALGRLLARLPTPVCPPALVEPLLNLDERMADDAVAHLRPGQVWDLSQGGG